MSKVNGSWASDFVLEQWKKLRVSFSSWRKIEDGRRWRWLEETGQIIKSLFTIYDLRLLINSNCRLSPVIIFHSSFSSYFWLWPQHRQQQQQVARNILKMKMKISKLSELWILNTNLYCNWWLTKVNVWGMSLYSVTERSGEYTYYYVE